MVTALKPLAGHRRRLYATSAISPLARQFTAPIPRSLFGAFWPEVEPSLRQRLSNQLASVDGGTLWPAIVEVSEIEVV